MNAFRVRKLYVDLVEPDGSVWICYFLDLHLAGFRQRIAGVERYPAAGPPSCQRAIGPVEWPANPSPQAPLRFSLNLAAGRVDFEGAVLLPAWTPGGDAPPLPFHWRVVAPRLEARLTYPGIGHTVSGMGYSDFVEIRRPPRGLGVRHLRWGRAHGPEGTVAFTAVLPRSGAAWRRAAHWGTSGGGTEWQDFHLEERPATTTLRLDGAAGPREFEFGHGRILRQGGATDGGRFPSLAERLLYRLLMGPTQESRWTGPVRPGDGNCPTGRTTVHESVVFGGATEGFRPAKT